MKAITDHSDRSTGTLGKSLDGMWSRRTDMVGENTRAFLSAIVVGSYAAEGFWLDRRCRAVERFLSGFL